MLLHGFVSSERTFHHQKVCRVRKVYEILGETGVRSIDKRFRVVVFQAQCQTFRAVRSRQSGCTDSRQDLKLRRWLDLDDLDFEWLFKQTVIIRVAHRLDYSTQTTGTKDAQLLGSLLHLRRPLRAKQKRNQAAHVIEMEVADPDGVEVWPVELFLRHAMSR